MLSIEGWTNPIVTKIVRKTTRESLDESCHTLIYVLNDATGSNLRAQFLGTLNRYHVRPSTGPVLVHLGSSGDFWEHSF